MRVSLRVVLVHEVAHARGEIEARPVVGDFGMAPRAVDIDEQEDVRRAVADVFVIDAWWASRAGPDRDPRFANELPRRFIEADHWPPRVRRLGVEREHVFHARHVLGADRRNPPHLLPPRLQLHLGQVGGPRWPSTGVACVVRRTSSPASRSSVQRTRPAGGAEHATASETGFIAGAELARRAGSRCFTERAGQAVLDKVSLRAIHGRCALRRRRPRSVRPKPERRRRGESVPV